MTSKSESGNLVIRTGRLVIWTDLGDSLLGTMTDKALAGMANIARASVVNRRNELSIPAFVAQAKKIKYTWSEAEIELLGTMSDVDVGESIGKPANIVRAKRESLDISRFGLKWTEEIVSMLGAVYDKDVAAASGFSMTSVERKRRSLNIPPFNAVKWDESKISLLGTMSDSKVAKILGVSSFPVYQKRKALGIPAAHKPQDRQL
mgnify:FL=1